MNFSFENSVFRSRSELIDGSGSFFKFNRCMNNRPRNLHKLMPKGS